METLNTSSEASELFANLPVQWKTIVVNDLDGKRIKGIVTGHSLKDAKPTIDYMCLVTTADGAQHRCQKWAWPEQLDMGAAPELEMGAYVWTAEDNAAASAQGWNLFEARGDFIELQLQREDEADVFPEDDDAAKYLQTQANDGDALALRAIAALISAGSSDIIRFDLKLPARAE